MKFKLLLSLLLVLITYSNSYASFPVKRTVKTYNEETEVVNQKAEVTYVPLAATVAKDLTVGIILWFFLGWAAGHRWYYGKPAIYNILFIITLGGLGVWWVIDLVNMIQGNF
tara:strand:+ start:1106 stop:1441 length:336 start_codon:yes stop_codon:yes gene_type:complete